VPRGNRYIADGLVYHLTHRCHDRSFLLKFAKDRKEYKARLRDALAAEAVDLLDYCVTSNHVHLLAFAEKAESVANMIQRAHGEMARWYNIRKRRTGAFWEGRYNCTMVEDGAHFMRCMVYIAMNMVRAGVVRHPTEWDWCGYKEIVGEKKRYRLVDRDRLVELSGAVSEHDFIENYRSLVEEAVSAGDTGREGRWTESLAVGSEDFVRRMGETFTSRVALAVEPEADGADAWTVRENLVPFASGRKSETQKTGMKNQGEKGMQLPEISPAAFFESDEEKTKLNWFCFEFAAEIKSHLGKPLLRKLKKEGVDAGDLAGFCIHYSKEMKTKIAGKVAGNQEDMVLSYLPIENYFSFLSDKLVDELLTVVGKAWDELTAMCVMCPTRCISEMNARAEMFDDPESYDSATGVVV